MASIINASTTSGLVQTADTSGTLELQSNGTTQLTVSSTGTYGQLKSGTAQASTSGTSIDFTSIPSWVKRITVMFSGVSTNGTSDIIVQLGDAGGFENTGYVSTGSSLGSTATTSAYTTGFAFVPTVLAASTYSGQMIISLLNAATSTWTCSALVTGGSTTIQMATGGKSTSATLDSVRITTVGGANTFDAGSINILYEG